MQIYPSDDSSNVNSSCSIGFFTQVPSCSTLNAFSKIFLFFCERKMNERNNSLVSLLHLIKFEFYSDQLLIYDMYTWNSVAASLAVQYWLSCEQSSFLSSSSFSTLSASLLSSFWMSEVELHFELSLKLILGSFRIWIKRRKKDALARREGIPVSYKMIT